MASRQENVQIWEDTKDICTEKFQNVSIPKSTLYKLVDAPIKPTYEYDKTIVKVFNIDTFTYCHQLQNAGYTVVGLNMANHRQSGGGVKQGSFAQEENLFRRSNYFMTLAQKLYPIPEDNCIYSPGVTVFKDQQYKVMDKDFVVSMIACAAIRMPLLDEDGNYVREKDRALMKLKIRTILYVAYIYGHEAIVLGSLGCGAFGNPPHEVAQLFNEVMDEFRGCFKYIGFGVKSFKDPNYDIFNVVINQT